MESLQISSTSAGIQAAWGPEASMAEPRCLLSVSLPEFSGAVAQPYDTMHEPIGESGRRVSWRMASAHGSLSATSASEGAWTLRAEVVLDQDATIESLAWRVRARGTHPTMLGDDYRWHPVTDPMHLNRLTSLAFRAESAAGFLAILGGTSLAGHSVAPAVDGVTPMTLWLDHSLAHPRFTFDGPQFRNWHNAYVLPAGHRFAATWHVLINAKPWPLVFLGRYPGSYRAAFSITDHADHDTCARLAALWYGSSRSSESSAGAAASDGFVGLRLPFTKSVFTATPEPDGPGLHYAPFAELCRVGKRAGIEICPHGIHSTNQPQVSEIPGLLDPFQEFQPGTWIDHGNRFLSNYGRRGWNPNDEFSLHPWLDRLGIRYVWGRIDFGHALPGGHLNQLAVDRFCGMAYLKDLPQNAWRALKSRRPWAAMHGASSLAFQLLPEPTMMQFFRAQRAVQRVMKADVTAVGTAAWNSLRMAGALAAPSGAQAVWHHLFQAREEISLAPIFFPEHHAVQRGSKRRWLFNTVAVHDVALAYAPEAVERLVEEYGLHLSHTYLTSVSRAHLSHAIEPDGGDNWRLTPTFAANLRHLAEQRDAGQLWVASLAEIGDFWSARLDIQLEPLGFGAWRICQGADSVWTSLPMQLFLDDGNSSRVRSLTLVPGEAAVVRPEST